MSGASNVKRCHWIPGGLAGLWLMLCISAGRPVVAADFSDQIVVMVSVDGLAGYYLDDPKAEMPTIRALPVSG